MKTLETGIGASTAVFMLENTQHICITPRQEQFTLFTEYCARKGLRTDSLEFHKGHSERVAPQLNAKELDVVLIDGGHGFPTPFIDWFYLAGNLKVGGIVLIDDVQIWTAKVLMQFLRQEPGWSQVGSLIGRTAVFQLTSPFEAKEHDLQPFVRRKSRSSGLAHDVREALSLTVQGDFKGLAKGIRKVVFKRR